MSVFLPMIANPLSGVTHDVYIANVAGLFHFDNNFNNAASGNGLGPSALVPFSVPNAAVTSNTQSKFGGFSCSLTASTKGAIGGSAAFSFGTGDFTIEFWAYLSTVSVGQNLIDFRTGEPQTTPLIGVGGPGAGILQYYGNGANRILSAGGTVSVNTWGAIALSRVSGTSRLFFNGSQVGSSFADTLNSSSGQVTVGSFNGTSGVANGFIDELRITKGVGRYTANYTVATAAFPNS